MTAIEQPNFVHFLKTIGVSPEDPCELSPLPAIESDTIPKATYSSFFEAGMRCIVSTLCDIVQGSSEAFGGGVTQGQMI